MDRKQTVSLEMVLMGIKPIDEEAVKAAKAHWDCVAKPLNSLGVLEEDICRIAGVKQREEFSLDKKCIVVMCADNGIVEEGVTQTGRLRPGCSVGNTAFRRADLLGLFRLFRHCRRGRCLAGCAIEPQFRPPLSCRLPA